MKETLIGLLGIFIGIAINEYFRRKSRIERHSSYIFEKRFHVYEKLLKHISRVYDQFDELYENKELSFDDKLNVSNGFNFEVLRFMDDHFLFLNESITIHISMTLIGSEEIFTKENSEDKRTKAMDEFREELRDVKLLIKDECGISSLNNLFSKITKSNPKSKYIDYYQKLKKESQ